MFEVLCDQTCESLFLHRWCHNTAGTGHALTKLLHLPFLGHTCFQNCTVRKLCLFAVLQQGVDMACTQVTRVHVCCPFEFLKASRHGLLTSQTIQLKCLRSRCGFTCSINLHKSAQLLTAPSMLKLRAIEIPPTARMDVCGGGC